MNSAPDDVTPIPAGTVAVSLASLTRVATLAYALQAAGIFIPPLWLAALIVSYLRRRQAAGTWLAGHYRWQIRSFWFGLLWAAIGVLTLMTPVGYLVLCVNALWLIYRVARGWLNLYDRLPVET